MAKTTKIIRKSIHIFLKNYHFCIMTSTLMMFPFSVILLFSQSFSPSSSSIFQTLSYRIYTLFHAVGFPASFQFFSLLNLKLSQTIFSYLFCLPFTLTFFLFSKAITIHMMQHELMHNTKTVTLPSLSSLFRLYKLLLPTNIFNSLAVLSANASVFSLLFIVFNTFEILGMSSENHILGLSASSAVLYSIVLANTTVLCSLATVISALENCRGCVPFLKACILVQGKEATAITVALPASLGIAAIEALFQYRVVRPHIRFGRFSVSAACESFLIAYMYSLLIVLDTIVSSVLYGSIKEDRSFEVDYERKSDLEA